MERKRTVMGASAIGALAMLAGQAAGQNQGPSSSKAAYVVPTAPGVVTTSILTVGDAAPGSGGPYRMVGLADGLGALNNPGTTSFSLFATHELGSGGGVVRAHGSTGAFISEWQINRSTLRVLGGGDLVRSGSDIYTWSGGSHAPGTTAWERFCSADLAAPSAYFNPATGLGTVNRIFTAGEETRPPFTPDHGRGFGTVLTGPAAGESWELAHLGRMSFENIIANPFAQDKTIVMGMDDAAANTSPVAPNVPCEMYMYVGNKRSTGNDIERAGLIGGGLFGMKVSVGGSVLTEESNQWGLGNGSFVGSAPFTMHGLGDVSGLSGVELQSSSIAADVFRMQRIEDGQWDPRAGFENDFYFVTTASFGGNSRLWRMRFDDIANPEAGGQLDILLEGSEGQKMMDNMTLDRWGNVLIQEDVGSNDRLGKIWNYHIATDTLTEIAQASPEFFDPNLLGLGMAGPEFLTRDEESSGIIDATDILGPGWFLIDMQAHYAIPGELAEGGQLIALFNPASVPSPGTVALAALGGLVMARRRR